MRTGLAALALMVLAGCGRVVTGRVFPRDVVEALDGQEVAEAVDPGPIGSDMGPGDTLERDRGDTAGDAVEAWEGGEVLEEVDTLEAGEAQDGRDGQEALDEGGGLDRGPDVGPPVGSVRHVGWFGPGGSGAGSEVRGVGWFSGFGHAWRR